MFLVDARNYHLHTILILNFSSHSLYAFSYNLCYMVSKVGMVSKFDRNAIEALKIVQLTVRDAIEVRKFRYTQDERGIIG